MKPNKPMLLPKRARSGDRKVPFLSEEVQDEVRLLVRRLKREYGGFRPLSEAIQISSAQLSVIVSEGESARFSITPAIMIRVCFLAGVSIDAILGRRFDMDGECIACGAPPNWKERDAMRAR